MTPHGRNASRYAARVDDNQTKIVDSLRNAGAVVTHMHTAGRGVPDLLVSYMGLWFVMEIKNRETGGKLNDDQVKWIAKQDAPVHVVYDGVEAVAILDRELQKSINGTRKDLR